MRRTGIAFAFCLLLHTGALGADTGPFTPLDGQWSGGGTVQLSNGAREQLRCRASYDVLNDGNKLQLSLRCASESYNFNLQSSANYAGGRVAGIWSEATLNTGGTLTGQADDRQIAVTAHGQSFSANLTLVTQGDRQSVAIQSTNPQSRIVGASIDLRRS